MQQWYSILGLKEGASIKEVKSTYKRLALKYHPDLNQGNLIASQKFIEIKQAYETILNPPADFLQKRESSIDPIKQAKINKEKAAAFKERKEILDKQREEKEFQEVLSSWIYKLYRFSLKLGIVLGIVILIDLISGPNRNQYVVYNVEAVKSNSDPTEYIFYLKNHTKTDYFKTFIPAPIRKNEYITLHESYLLNANYRIEYNGGTYENMYNVFSHLLMGLFLCVGLPMLAWTVKGPHPFYYVLLHAGAFFPILILLIILVYV